MELVPRISRAQSMDALSSMATVAGYKAVVMLPRTGCRGCFRMLMTAAGTIPPARVFVIGAGVAGLQAIATARRLGAVVEAYDVRAAAGEQVRSLGAKFLDVDLGGINTEGGGGYAAELTEEALDRGRDLITKTAAHSDVIVTTAQVPGRPAPLLIRRAAVEAMRPGSVLVDLAAPAGGNCELTRPGMTQIIGGVTLLAPLNLPAEVPVHAQPALRAGTSCNFLALIVKKGALELDLADEVLAGACVAHEGKPVNPRVAELLEVSRSVTSSFLDWLREQANSANWCNATQLAFEREDESSSPDRFGLCFCAGRVSGLPGHQPRSAALAYAARCRQPTPSPASR